MNIAKIISTVSLALALQAGVLITATDVLFSSDTVAAASKKKSQKKFKTQGFKGQTDPSWRIGAASNDLSTSDVFAAVSKKRAKNGKTKGFRSQVIVTGRVG